MTETVRIDVQWEESGRKGFDLAKLLRAELAGWGGADFESEGTAGLGEGIRWHLWCTMPGSGIATTFTLVGMLLMRHGLYGTCAVSPPSDAG